MPTPGSCEIFQPSSIIWNTVLSLVGILTIASAYMIYRGLGNRLFSSLVGLFGLGALIAGVVPENVGLTTHNLAARVSFVAEAIAAVTVYRVKLEAPPHFRYLSMLFGLISLAGLAIMLSRSFATLESSAIGHGGDERIIVYPLYIEKMRGRLWEWYGDRALLSYALVFRVILKTKTEVIAATTATAAAR